MPPERFAPDDPRAWLSRARSNLAQAGARQPDVYLEDLCFNAQQAAEKALKARLLCRHIRFPYVHDLGELLRLLEQSGEPVPSDVRDVVQITGYAVESRYPAVGEPVDEKEYQRALALAEGVVRWVSGRLRSEE